MHHAWAHRWRASVEWEIAGKSGVTHAQHQDSMYRLSNAFHINVFKNMHVHFCQEKKGENKT